MTPLDHALFNTRKSILDAVAETGVEYTQESDISLEQCACCGVWLKTFEKDLDGLNICKICLDEYGP